MLQSQLKLLSEGDVVQEVKRYQKSQGGRSTAFHASGAASAQLSSPALRALTRDTNALHRVQGNSTHLVSQFTKSQDDPQNPSLRSFYFIYLANIFRPWKKYHSDSLKHAK